MHPTTTTPTPAPDNKFHLQDFAREGELTIFGGRPAMGRTSVALNIALSLQEQTGGKAIYFDLDCMHSHIDRRLRTITGEIVEPTPLFERTQPSALPLRLWDARNATVSQIVACSRKAAAQTPIAAIFVDWLQLLFENAPTSDGPVHIARDLVDLRLLAQELGVPVIALASLPRELEERNDKRPRLTDFAMGGLPDTACDRFVAIYRHYYYHTDGCPHCQTDTEAHPSEPTELLVWDGDKTERTTHILRFDAHSGKVDWGPES